MAAAAAIYRANGTDDNIFIRRKKSFGVNESFAYMAAVETAIFRFFLVFFFFFF